ncbi:MAG: hypothetical protein LBI87_02810 [Candidatus Accumulibacter sp.]|nr:hypothetical protein [Accumulibacter sp.]
MEGFKGQRFKDAALRAGRYTLDSRVRGNDGRNQRRRSANRPKSTEFPLVKAMVKKRNGHHLNRKRSKKIFAFRRDRRGHWFYLFSAFPPSRRVLKRSRHRKRKRKSQIVRMGDLAFG